jgi:hypothetical protein
MIKIAGKDESTNWLILNLHDKKIKKIPNLKKYLNKTYKRSTKESIPHERLPIDGKISTDILLDESGRFLGASAFGSSIEAKKYDLRPENYVKTIEEERPLQSPASLLAEIRKNQKELITRIDNLLGHLDVPPIAKEKIPPSIWSDGKENIQAFGMLSEDQKKIWQIISSKQQKFDDQDETYMIPTHFSLDDIKAEVNQESIDSLNNTLELFEKMGLIIPVNLKTSESDEVLSYYRLVCEKDRWQSIDEDVQEEKES